jgi:hypothetical protein
MAHGLDTNMNEAFNQICTWFAPKNKVFAGSGSLHNCIALAVGINSLGVEDYFTRLYGKLCIEMTDNVMHYLKVKEKSRVARLAKIRTKEAKLNKNKKKYEDLKKHTIIAKTQLHKREGTYRQGMNLDDPYADIPVENTIENNDDGAKKPAAKRRKLPEFCEYCGKKGHTTKRSKNCPAAGTDNGKKYRRNDGSLLVDGVTHVKMEEDEDEVPLAPSADPIPALFAALQQQEDAGDIEEPTTSLPLSDADDEEQYASLPWDTQLADSDDEDDDFELYHDASTWSDSDEEVTVLPII